MFEPSWSSAEDLLDLSIDGTPLETNGLKNHLLYFHKVAKKIMALIRTVDYRRMK
jgi:hypothetical protein